MKKFIPIILAVLSAAACSEKVQEASPGRKLGEIYVSAAPGSRPVLVNLDGLWRVRSCDDWLTTDVNGRDGRGAFTFHYASNESDFVTSNPVRRGALVIQSLSTMKADTLYVLQQGVPDGKDYESLTLDSYIEFPEDELKSVTVLYANVQGASADAADAWLASVGADINCIISDSGLEISRKDAESVEALGTLTEPAAVLARVDGLNLALADFGSVPADESTYYDYTVALLSASYDRPGADARWLVGGSFYYLSAMETGYADTPEWYPANPSDEVFAADRYAQGAGLADCVWMSARDFTPTYSDGAKSWRADYVYASNSVWNSVTAVSVLEGIPAGAQHRAILIKLKY